MSVCLIVFFLRATIMDMVYCDIINPIFKESNVVGMNVDVPESGEPYVPKVDAAKVDVEKYFINEQKFMLNKDI